MITRMKNIAALCTFAAAAWLHAAPVWAELPAKPGAIEDAGKPYVAYLAAVVLIGAIAAISFKPSKRTHLD